MHRQAARSNCVGWSRAIALVLLLVASLAVHGRSEDIVARSPLETLADNVLFDDIREPGKQLYLPRYRLAVQNVSGNSQYRVRFYKKANDTMLEAYLEKYPASELGDAARTARQLPHQTRVSLKYNLPPAFAASEGASQKEVTFQELSEEKNALKATLRITTLQEREALIVASSNANLNAFLIVRRTFTALTTPATELGRLQKEIAEKDEAIRTLQAMHRDCDEIIKKRPGPSATQVEAVTYLSCSQKVALLQSNEFIHSTKRRELQGQVDALLRQRTPLTTTLDNREPFYFDQGRHPYVYAGVVAEPATKPQLVREQVAFRDRYFSYFRTPDRTNLWYYLPDRFVLAKKDQLPTLRVQFTGPPESQSVDLEYQAVPSVDSARLEAARSSLRAAPGQDVKLEPLVASQLELWTALTGAGGDGAFQKRTGAVVDLRDGLRDQVRMTPEGFQKLYAALFGESHTLFTGEVRFSPDGVNSERVPFEARVTELSPEAFWDKAISPLVFADYQRTIVVKTTASVFVGEVKALVVSFKESDDDAELIADKLEAQITVKLPMKDFILNSGNGEYHYKVTAVRERNGKVQTTKMPSWKSSTEAILYPEVP